MKTVRLLVVLSVLFMVAASSGCGISGGSGGKLERIRWVLESYDSNGTIENAPTTLTVDAFFSGGQVSGFSGVNTYVGSYTTSGNELAVTNVVTTKMSNTQDRMALEAAYMANLQNSSTYSAEKNSLTIYDADNKEILKYKKGNLMSLTDGTWNAVNYNNGQGALTGIVSGTTLTASFNKDGSMTGSDGNNEYQTTYVISKNTMSIGAPQITKSGKSTDETVIQQAAAYQAALQRTATYEITGSQLELFDSDGSTLATFNSAE